MEIVDELSKQLQKLGELNSVSSEVVPFKSVHVSYPGVKITGSRSNRNILRKTQGVEQKAEQCPSFKMWELEHDGTEDPN